jgi:hypothetical protein
VLVALTVCTDPGVALAGKSGGSNGGPKSNTATKTQTSNTPQNTTAKKSNSGKVSVKEFNVKKTTD